MLLSCHIEDKMGVASTNGQDKNAYKIVIRNMKGRDQFEEPSINRRIILKWILKK
jgi:hypothetical protein